MSKAEILAELPRLKSGELAEIQSKIEELAVYGPDGAHLSLLHVFQMPQQTGWIRPQKRRFHALNSKETRRTCNKLRCARPDGWLVDDALTEAEKRLIETRLDDAERHPEKSIPWAEAEAQLKARFGE